MKKQELTKKVIMVEHVDKIQLFFDYHPKTIAIVKRIGSGRYRERPKRHWEFSNNKRNSILRTFRSHGYYVEIQHVMPDEPGVTEVLLTCKKCRKQAFVGSEGLCARCRSE